MSRGRISPAFHPSVGQAHGPDLGMLIVVVEGKPDLGRLDLEDIVTQAI